MPGLNTSDKGQKMGLYKELIVSRNLLISSKGLRNIKESAQQKKNAFKLHILLLYKDRTFEFARHQHAPVLQRFCLLSGLPMATVVLLLPRQQASSKVSLLNYDTYRWDSVILIVSSFGQIEQGAH